MPDAKGAEVFTAYMSLAKEHGRQGLLDYRNHRPNRSDKHTRAMRLLNRAAIAERDDPPLDLDEADEDPPEDPPLLPPRAGL